MNIGEERNWKLVLMKNEIENYDNEGEGIKDEEMWMVNWKGGEEAEIDVEARCSRLIFHI